MLFYHPQEDHIKVIIALLEKYGRDPKVLDVLCSLCVGNGTAVRYGGIYGNANGKD